MWNTKYSAPQSKSNNTTEWQKKSNFEEKKSFFFFVFRFNIMVSFVFLQNKIFRLKSLVGREHQGQVWETIAHLPLETSSTSLPTIGKVSADIHVCRIGIIEKGGLTIIQKSCQVKWRVTGTSGDGHIQLRSLRRVHEVTAGNCPNNQSRHWINCGNVPQTVRTQSNRNAF